MPEPRDDEAAELDEHDADRRFSQEQDDLAGRSWHGMTSETPIGEVGRFDDDADDTVESNEPTGRIERV